MRLICYVRALLHFQRVHDWVPLPFIDTGRGLLSTGYCSRCHAKIVYEEWKAPQDFLAEAA